MEGAARLKSAYNHSRLSVCCTRCCCSCCVDKKTYRRKLFSGQWLKVEQSVEPSLIIWENLGLSLKNRCIRTTGAALISLILLLATTLLILYVKVFETDLKQDDVICGTAGSSITLNEAWTDYQLPDDQMQNLMYCYCRNIFWSSISKGKNPNDEFKTIVVGNDEKPCVDWFKDYTLSKSLLYAVPFSILLVNLISKTILRKLATMYGY